MQETPAPVRPGRFHFRPFTYFPRHSGQMPATGPEQRFTGAARLPAVPPTTPPMWFGSGTRLRIPIANRSPRRTIMRHALLLLAAGFAPTLAVAADPPARPNVVVILSDDQGRGDYSAFGTTDVRTPHIDRLFREGMGFDNFYANCPVCSPTRAALLTGCYPDRVGVPGVIREERPDDSWGWLAPDAVLLPKVLGPAGYHSAVVGKWHLGLTAPNTPTDRGFDVSAGSSGT